MKAHEVGRWVEKHGYQYTRTRKGHNIYQHPNGHILVVPQRHGTAHADFPPYKLRQMECAMRQHAATIGQVRGARYRAA